MKIELNYFAVCGLLATCLFLSLSTVMTASTKEQTRTTISSDYLEALQTANVLLMAWVERDADRGLASLSDHLRVQIKDASWFRQFMTGLSNPHHQAFEIKYGEKVSSNRFKFNVILYELYTGQQSGSAYSSSIEVIREGKTWLIDSLPKSSDNP